MNRRMLALVALAALTACGPKYARGVPKEVISRLPYESRVELLEAENALMVAVDRVDEADNEVLRTREALRRARSRLHDANIEKDRARDDISKDVARLAVEEAQARLEFLRRRQDYNAQAREVEALAFRCAYARFEQSRLQVARKAKVEGSEKLDPKDFAKQVEDCDAEVARRKGELKDEDERAQKAKLAWDDRRTALSKKTFDARASPYVE